ncbi:hypothetical protein GUJ93_ZPchr0012g19566 [Zizania palustris]|uniref:F-box domain-containing protein n=1 Tax=Zizania palustris TaxID=103762 RepID=A0A8J5WMY5_ZIZPA|nr:hypothetical protein GUJ93_ZPchr0012g19566 [Zizania palustris]
MMRQNSAPPLASRQPRPAMSSIKQSRQPLSPSRGESSNAMERRGVGGGGVGGDGGVGEAVAEEKEEEPYVERLPADLLAHVLTLLPSFYDLAMAGGVSRRWRWAVERSLAGRRRLSFAGQRTGDDSTARLVRAAVNLRDLDICWGCHVTDQGLLKISTADCVKNLTSISLWGLAGITDNGVIHLVISTNVHLQLTELSTGNFSPQKITGDFGLTTQCVLYLVKC